MISKFRVRLLEQADHELAKARQFTSRGDFGFSNAMKRAACRYRTCGLGLLSRRVMSTRDKLCRAWKHSPADVETAVAKAWLQFDELNATDHFCYAVQRFEGAE